MATATAPSTALTVVDRVEKSAAVMAIDANSQALVDLLPDAAAVSRFRRVVIQALMKNPELLECTPESVVRSVFEAAAMGLEPTGASGGAHLVPYNVKVSKNPDRYEKQAQLIPDYRGVIRLVTKQPSEVVSLEARVAKEGDEFAYQLGTDAFVQHVPSLSPDRSAKATTHVYAVARLKNGERIPDVMDRAEIAKIQGRGRGSAFSPWATDWDEMAKKTVIKRIAKNLPVRPEVRSILVREDELDDGGEGVEDQATATAGPTKASRLAARLAPKPVEPPASTEGDVVEGSFIESPATPASAAPEAPEEPLWMAAPKPDFVTQLRDSAAATDDGDALASPDELAPLRDAFAGFGGFASPGFLALWPGDDGSKPSKGQAHAIATVHDSRGHEAFEREWRALVESVKAVAS
jgi:recombination protein RecT